MPGARPYREDSCGAFRKTAAATEVRHSTSSAAAHSRKAASSTVFETEAVAKDWQSKLVPATIRRPWRVFAEDLEDRVADALREGAEIGGALQKRLAAVEAKGVLAAFKALPTSEQRTYAEVSLLELSAYVCWRQAHEAQLQRPDDAPYLVALAAARDKLDCDDMAEWVPMDAREALLDDGRWAPFLADGPPVCDT